MPRILANLVLTAILVALTGGVLVYVNRIAEPPARILPPVGATSPEYGRILQQVTENSVRDDLAAVASLGSRFTGSAGCDSAAGLLAAQFNALGYRVIEQPFEVTIPVTRHAQITDENGGEIPGVSITPLLPSWFRTATVPAEGLTGSVFKAEFGLAREFEGKPVRDNFVLLPLGTSINTAVGMGASAVIFYDDGRKMSSQQRATPKASINIPRLLLMGDPAQLDGKRVTIKVRVDFERRSAKNLIAVLDPPGAGGSGEAVVINAFYDAYSFAPDHAPGGEQAGGVVALLAAARELKAQSEHHRRSVILLATAGHGQALSGVRNFLGVLGPAEDRGLAVKTTDAALASKEKQLAAVEAAHKVADDSAYWAVRTDSDELAYWGKLPAEAREAFLTIKDRVLDQRLDLAVEETAQRRVDWVRGGLSVREADGSPSRIFTVYNAARDTETAMVSLLSTAMAKLKQRLEDRPEILGRPLRDAVLEVAAQRAAMLREERDKARVEAQIAGQLAGYQRLLFLSLDLTSRSGRVGMAAGTSDLAKACVPADAEVASQLQHAAEAFDAIVPDGAFLRTVGKQPRIVNLIRETDTRGIAFLGAWGGSPAYFESSAALYAGHTGVALFTLDDDRENVGTPRDDANLILNPPPPKPGAKPPKVKPPTPVENLVMQARLTTALACQFARGQGLILPVALAPDLLSIRGTVVSQVGDNLTPNHLMPGAIVRMGPVATQFPGVDSNPVLTAGWDGRFELRDIWPRALSTDYYAVSSVDAAMVDQSTGQVTWVLSTSRCGPTGLFRTVDMKVAQYRRTEATPVLFRAQGVQVFPMSNPITLGAYAGFDFVESKTLAPPKDSKVEVDGNASICFVPPESRLFFTFKDGKKTSPNLMEIQAFAFGDQPGTADRPAGAGEAAKADATGPELSGPGYFAADVSTVTNLELDAASSMARVNDRRVALQARYDMADEMMTGYQARAKELSKESFEKFVQGDIVNAKRAASDSLAYGANIHPVIRKNASDAVWGILFYLALAIPFAFFLEKLLFGNPDLRWQIVYQSLIFMAFFGILWLVHPAYSLVRSSLVILLGFITFILAIVVSAFVGAKFSNNIAAINRAFQQRAEAADVSRAGAAATAFLLGLNNLRKRPIRTGLTAGTLVLMTFVMICFTSVSSDLVDIEFPMGKAAYDGLLIRDRGLKDVTAMLPPLMERYGKDHRVAQRTWGGNFEVTPAVAPETARIWLNNDVAGKVIDSSADAVLGLSIYEPDITNIKDCFVILNRWFEKPTEFSCFLPRRLADELRLDEQKVREGAAVVKISGKDYTVLGIFDGPRLDAMLDLDGQPLVPLDIRQLRLPTQGGNKAQTADETETPESVARLPADNVIITPTDAMPMRTLTASIAVGLKNVDYAAARAIVNSHLERTGQPAYYGLGVNSGSGIAFYGGKFRLQSVQGLLDLILPMVLSALTVLNTMRGSVYERRSELYVFNAVGLAPNHIKSLFLAEACVYAVLGAVGGYLLAQGVGTTLKLLGLTAGMTINYSSLSSVFVSIVIMSVVLLASLQPARMASRLAAPAETMTRRRQSATGDALELDLPFTFNRRDRIAIIPYFTDWFDNFGEGSAGEFFCSPPKPGIKAVGDVQKLGQDALATSVETTTWLKPYDLGVSQSVEVVVRRDPSSGDNIATVVMTRKSGDKESWERCCHAFVGLLRKRFLTWRAIGDADRQLLLERGRKMLDPNPSSAGSTAGRGDDKR